MAGGGRFPRRRSWISWIRRHRGASKLGTHGRGDDDIVEKPDNRSCGEWISVRGHRIRRGGRMRVDANGDVYIPDSDDDESGMEVVAGSVEVANFPGASVTADIVETAVDGVPADGDAVGADAFAGDAVGADAFAGDAVGADAVAGDGVDVATEGVSDDAIEVAAQEGATDVIKVVADTATGEEMHPKVEARLKMFLAHMDPAFRDIFVSMYKVMVPAFFNP